MIQKPNSPKKQWSKLTIVLYVISAIMATVFILVTISSIQYISSYANSYGVTVASMLKDSVQYVITSSFGYLAYAVIIFGIAKILSAVSPDAVLHTEESEGLSSKKSSIVETDNDTLSSVEEKEESCENTKFDKDSAPKEETKEDEGADK